MATLEDDGQGNTYNVNAEFRSYPSYVESLQDYVTILKHSRYTYAWKSNTTSYMNATAALTGVYATDTSYNVKLNNMMYQMCKQPMLQQLTKSTILIANNTQHKKC